jgi:hypothetical protein
MKPSRSEVICRRETDGEPRIEPITNQLGAGGQPAALAPEGGNEQTPKAIFLHQSSRSEHTGSANPPSFKRLLFFFSCRLRRKGAGFQP